MVTNTTMALAILPIASYYGEFVQLMVPDHYSKTMLPGTNTPAGYNTFEMAIAHVGFNVALVLVFFPMLNVMTKVVR